MSVDPLFENAMASKAFWERARPADARGAADEVTTLHDPFPPVRIERDDAQPPSRPSAIVEGGDRRSSEGGRWW